MLHDKGEVYWTWKTFKVMGMSRVQRQFEEWNVSAGENIID